MSCGGLSSTQTYNVHFLCCSKVTVFGVGYRYLLNTCYIPSCIYSSWQPFELDTVLLIKMKNRTYSNLKLGQGQAASKCSSWASN